MFIIPLSFPLYPKSVTVEGCVYVNSIKSTKSFTSPNSSVPITFLWSSYFTFTLKSFFSCAEYAGQCACCDDQKGSFLLINSNLFV